jgi:hypothetical protein
MNGAFLDLINPIFEGTFGQFKEVEQPLHGESEESQGSEEYDSEYDLLQHNITVDDSSNLIKIDVGRKPVSLILSKSSFTGTAPTNLLCTQTKIKGFPMFFLPVVKKIEELHCGLQNEGTHLQSVDFQASKQVTEKKCPVSPFFFKFVFINRGGFLRFAIPSGGEVAQLVEQWTENPCVGGSIPSLTTTKKQKRLPFGSLFCFLMFGFGGERSEQEKWPRVAGNLNPNPKSLRPPRRSSRRTLTTYGFLFEINNALLFSLP